MRTSFLPAVSLLAVFALPAVADGPISPIWHYKVTQMTVTDLGTTANYPSSEAVDINNLGDVVGTLGSYDHVGSAYVRPFYMRPGSIPMQLFTEGVSSSARALGINDSRITVGWMRDSQSVEHGFFWKPGLVATPLLSEPMPLFGVTWESQALAVSDTGQIVGWASANPPLPPSPTCLRVAVYWSSTQAIPAPIYCPPEVPNWHTLAVDVNGAGTIVGNDFESLGFPTGMFMKKNGSVSAIPLPAASADVNYQYGVVDGLNGANQVAGTASRSDGKAHAFYWNGTSPTATDIGVPAGGFWSEAFDINEQQMLVGVTRFMTRSARSQAYRAPYIWHAHFGFKVLPTLFDAPYPPLCEALALNDRKESGLVQVVGRCDNEDGRERAVLWNVTVVRETVVIPPAR